MAQELPNTNDIIDPENRVNQWLKEYKETDSDATKRHLRELIVLAYMPLVKKVARSLARRSTDPIEDITQVGALGLIKSIDLFKPEIRSNFRTYATYLITGEIRHYLRDKSTIIRAPREIKELSYRVHKITLELTEKLGTTPSDKELAQALQMSEKKIEEVFDLDRRTTAISIDQIVGNEEGGGAALSDRLVDESQKDIIAGFENRLILNEAIKKLDNDEQQLIILNYFEGLNQREISQRLDMSQMQVSRKLKKALDKLFNLIKKKGLYKYEHYRSSYNIQRRNRPLHREFFKCCGIKRLKRREHCISALKMS